MLGKLWGKKRPSHLVLEKDDENQDFIFPGLISHNWQMLLQITLNGLTCYKCLISIIQFLTLLNCQLTESYLCYKYIHVDLVCPLLDAWQITENLSIVCWVFLAYLIRSKLYLISTAQSNSLWCLSSSLLQRSELLNKTYKHVGFHKIQELSFKYFSPDTL